MNSQISTEDSYFHCLLDHNLECFIHQVKIFKMLLIPCSHFNLA